MLQKKRSYLERELSQLGFKVLPAQGTYFLVADFSGLLPEGSTEGDVEVGWGAGVVLQVCTQLHVACGASLLQTAGACQCL